MAKIGNYKIEKESQLNLQKILKIAVVTEWILAIAYLPASKNNTWVSDVNIVVSLTTGPWVVGYIISSIGVFFLKPWGKWSYITLYAFNLVLGLFTGPIVEQANALANVISNSSEIAAIIIICMLLFANVIPKKKT